MASTVFDSFLFQDSFSTPQMREIFSDAGYVERIVRTEVALARAEARAGVIPAWAATEIGRLCDPTTLDRGRLGRDTGNVGYPVLPVVTQLAEQCGAAGGFLHWGATTQDIVDTATVLQCADGLELVSAALDEVRQTLRGLALEHIDTVAAGRTHLRHAVPVTFGYRAAVWLSALDRHAERLAAVRERDLMVQLGGAAGTLASLGPGPAGLEVRSAMAEELGLRDPEITWHVARDGLVSIVSLLAAIGGSIGKIGLDLSLMCAEELSELAEPYVAGRGSSSTMPQKRNPISSELMVAAAKLLRDRAGAMLDAMVHDFERATGPWHVEWVALPEAFLLISSALHQARFALSGLQVDVARMRSNMDLSHGLIVAEAVMMALAPVLGRQQAHHVVYEVCRAAIEGRSDLATELKQRADILSHLDAREIDQLCDPASYLGSARRMTAAVIGTRSGAGTHQS